MKIKFPRITNKHKIQLYQSGVEIYGPSRGEYYLDFPFWFKDAIRRYGEEQQLVGRRQALQQIKDVLGLR